MTGDFVYNFRLIVYRCTEWCCVIWRTQALVDPWIRGTRVRLPQECFWCSFPFWHWDPVYPSWVLALCRLSDPKKIHQPRWLAWFMALATRASELGFDFQSLIGSYFLSWECLQFNWKTIQLPIDPRSKMCLQNLCTAPNPGGPTPSQANHMPLSRVYNTPNLLWGSSGWYHL